jgi:N utilization substance protein B
MKNLSQYKEKVNARELLVQALYEFSFGHNSAKSIEDSFRKDFRKTKIDYILFRNIFSHITKDISELKKVVSEIAEVEMFGIRTIEVLIDEGVRLSKKFCSQNSYKFINATLEKILKS